MKKNFLTLCLLLALLLSGTAQAAAPTSVEVPIIMYHKVTKDAGQLGAFAITPEELAADFAFLRESDYQVVTMQALIDFVLGEGKLPQNPIVLTFDDGYFSDYLYAYPLVQQYNIPIVSSIIGHVADEYKEEPPAGIIYPHLTWPQMAEMVKSGLVEIQNHGYDLHCTRHGATGAEKRPGESFDAYQVRLGEDLTKLQTRAQTELGRVPNTFTYPFGAQSEDSDTALRNLGFQASLSVEGRWNTVTRGEPDCLFRMGRLIRPHGKSLERVLQK